MKKDSPCYPNPCENGGTCEDIGDAVIYMCVCPTNYSGQNCTDASKFRIKSRIHNDIL